MLLLLLLLLSQIVQHGVCIDHDKVRGFYWSLPLLYSHTDGNFTITTLIFRKIQSVVGSGC